MADTTYKAQTLARDLSDKWAKEVAATLPVIVQTADSNGNPVLTLSADATPTTGEKIIVVRVLPMAWPEAKDSLGNTAIKYSHHVIQICTEKNYEGTTDSVLDILGPTELLPVICEIAKTGCIVEWYRTANGTAPTSGGMIAANLAATFQDLYWNILKAV